MSRPVILHVAQVDITPESGMGRVAWHWRRELEARGYEVVHLGPSELGRVHPMVFPWKAWQRATKLHPDLILVHEPAGLPFVLFERDRTVVFSHGLERRGWEAALEGEEPIRLRSRLLFPLWRLWPAELSLMRARAVLVLNCDDYAEVLRLYGHRAEDVHLFRNGVTPVPTSTGTDTILFLGTWMTRKGTRTLVRAAEILGRQGRAPSLLLAGTGLEAQEVLADWPAELHQRVRVLPRFAANEEAGILSQAGVFVLPSTFEGQPLALLQAMAAGLCCIASDIPGSRDLIRHGETGLLHPSGDAEALANCLTTALDDPALRRRLGENARRSVADRTWEACAREVADFLEPILGDPR
jgi:glycosyltransferase involved in cell wall biosynthesis